MDSVWYQERLDCVAVCNKFNSRREYKNRIYLLSIDPCLGKAKGCRTFYNTSAKFISCMN